MLMFAACFSRRTPLEHTFRSGCPSRMVEAAFRSSAQNAHYFEKILDPLRPYSVAALWAIFLAIRFNFGPITRGSDASPSGFGRLATSVFSRSLFRLSWSKGFMASFSAFIMAQVAQIRCPP